MATITPRTRRAYHALVREELKKRGRLTKLEVAELLDVTISTVDDYLKGIDGVIRVMSGRNLGHFELDTRGKNGTDD